MTSGTDWSHSPTPPPGGPPVPGAIWGPWGGGLYGWSIPQPTEPAKPPRHKKPPKAKHPRAPGHGRTPHPKKAPKPKNINWIAENKKRHKQQPGWIYGSPWGALGSYHYANPAKHKHAPHVPAFSMNMHPRHRTTRHGSRHH